MTSLATDARNDLYLNADGNLSVAYGVEAVRQDCDHAMKAQLGEMVLNLQRGVPTLQTIWEKWNPIQFEAYARQMLLSVPNVLSVVAFTVTRTGDVATYQATVKTTYGTATVLGAING